MNTGRVVALVGPEKAEIQEFPLPVPVGADAVLEVVRANVCGSDVHIYEYRNPKLRDIVLGHEFVARIAALGPGLATDFSGQPVAVGDRVVVVYFDACQRCASCARGEFNMCSAAMVQSATPPLDAPHFHGAFATHYYLHPGQYFYKVPDDLPDAVVAGANCGLAQVLFTLDQMELRAGEHIVVQGAGGLGLYAAAIAHDRGARVIVVERSGERLAQAAQFGADNLVDLTGFPDRDAAAARIHELTDGGADVVLEVTGHPSAFLDAVDFVRVGGRIASVGVLNVGDENAVPVQPATFARKNLTVRGFLRYHPWYLRSALDFLHRTRDRHPYGLMSDREFGLDEIDGALERARERRVARVGVVPGRVG